MSREVLSPGEPAGAVLDRPLPQPVDIFDSSLVSEQDIEPSGSASTTTEWELEVRHGCVMAEIDLIEFLQGRPVPDWYREAHLKKTKPREFTSVVKVPKLPSPVPSY